MYVPLQARASTSGKCERKFLVSHAFIFIKPLAHAHAHTGSLPQKLESKFPAGPEIIVNHIVIRLVAARLGPMGDMQGC